MNKKAKQNLRQMFFSIAMMAVSLFGIGISAVMMSIDGKYIQGLIWLFIWIGGFLVCLPRFIREVKQVRRA